MNPKEIVFRISGEKYQRLIQWKREMDAKVYCMQKGLPENEVTPDMMYPYDVAEFENLQNGKWLYPYYGFAGEAYEYRFLPSSIGMNIWVRSTFTGEVLNLSDENP